MAFLAPFAGLIGSALGIGGSLLGGGQSKQAKQSADYLGQAQQKGFQVADTAQRQAQPFFSQANQYIPQAASYYQNLLSGNRNEMDTALAPERAQTASQFRSARNSIMAAPRGGGRTSALAQLPTQEASANALGGYGVRPAAAQGLLGAGIGAGGMGSGLLNSAVQGIYGTSGAANSLLNYDLQQQAANKERGESIGGSIFDLITQIGKQPWKTGGGGGQTISGSGIGSTGYDDWGLGAIR
jgi:hypothetical protein